LKTLVVDKDPAAPGARAADLHLPVGTASSVSILSTLASYAGTDTAIGQWSIVAVVTRSSGHAAIATAQVAARLGLPGAGGSVERLIRKDGLADLCREAGIPHPGIAVVEVGETIDADRHDSPCVVKPAFGLSGKVGVTCIQAGSDPGGAIATARKEAPDGVVVLERYLPGRDITLLGYVLESRFTSFRFLEEKNSFGPAGDLRHDRFEADPELEEEERSSMTGLAEQLAVAAAVGCSPMLVSFRLQEDGETAPVEVNLDFGGEGVLERSQDQEGSPFIRAYLNGLREHTAQWGDAS
jgi:biotin carboxylase